MGSLEMLKTLPPAVYIINAGKMITMPRMKEMAKCKWGSGACLSCLYIHQEINNPGPVESKTKNMSSVTVICIGLKCRSCNNAKILSNNTMRFERPTNIRIYSLTYQRVSEIITHRYSSIHKPRLSVIACHIKTNSSH